MHLVLSRPSALFTAFLALVPHRSSPPLAESAPVRERGSGVPRVLAAPFFPYPEAVQLLDVLAGTRPAQADPGRGHGAAPDASAIPYPKGRTLLELVGRTADAALENLREMRRACRRAADPRLGPDERAREQELYRLALRRFVKLQGAADLDGRLIDGSRDVVLVRPPGGELFVDLPDWRAETLALAGSIPDAAAAQSALDLVDEAHRGVERERVQLLVALQELVEGVPDGGLREVERLLKRMRQLAEQAASATLNTAARTLLQIRSRSDLARLDEVARAARFEGLPLLHGGEVVLQGRLGTTLVLELPRAGAADLGLHGADVTVLTGAMEAFEELGAALHYVSAQRSAVEEARDALENGLLRLR